jgi:TPR repeat protein
LIQSMPADTPPIAPPAPPAASAPPPDIVMFLQRGDALLANGDVTAARLFYQRAAERGDPTGTIALAKAYDPLFLEQAGLRQARGDVAIAAAWYRTAATAGDAEAARRLEQLRQSPAPPSTPP